MPFFGSSDTQKIDQGRIPEIGNWYFDQMKGNLGNSQGQTDQGKWLQQFGIDSQLDRYNKGFGDAGSIRQTGAQVMPGVDDAIAQRNARLNQILQNYQPGTQQTVDQLNDIGDQFGQGVSQTADNIGNDINSTYKRMSDRGQASTDDLMSRTAATYGKAGTDWNNAYGDMRKGNADTYGGLRADNAKTFADLTGKSDATYGNLLDQAGKDYSERKANLEKTAPGGQFQAAMTGRAFAPAAAAQLSRLRRAGIDSNSPEAASALSGVDTARAAAMDDSQARFGQQYAKSQNDLISGNQANVQNLQKGRLAGDTSLGTARLGNEATLGTQQQANETALGTNQAQGNTGLTLGQGQTERDTLASGTKTQQDLDAARRAQMAQNSKDWLSGQQAYLGVRANNAGLARNMNLQDWNNTSGVLRDQNANDLTNLGLKKAEFDAGADLTSKDLAERNAAAGNIAGMGQNAFGNAINYGNLAKGYGDAATRNYQTSYGMEAPNANWGGKLLAGLGSSALQAWL